MSSFDDIMGGFSKDRSQYSEKEIDEAGKLAKKKGITLLEALQELTGKSLKTDFDLSEEIQSLNQSLYRDFGVLSEKNRENAEIVSGHTAADTLTYVSGAKTSEEPIIVTADTFDGVEDVVSGEVYGQENFVKKLAVAFKRPYILPEEPGHARNSFFITGPKDTGKHMALQKMTEELANRKVLQSKEIYTMDLSIYTAAGKDNVFLQDLYAAIMAPANVILFENFDACHISYLTYLSDLVVKGSCRLSERYILQKGQLVNVTNSFASEAVSSFSAKGKYLVLISDKGISELANVLGAPFINALGDVCSSEALTEENYRKIAETEWKKLQETSEKQFTYELMADPEEIIGAALSETGKGAGTEGLLSFFEKLLRSLATARLEGTFPKNAVLTLSVSDSRLIAASGDSEADLFSGLPGGYTGEIEAVKKELSEIVGLTKVKEYILSLEEYYATQKRRKEAGLKASEVSKHMIFTGHPGTGKTTIARIISRYLKAIGVLSGGQLVEVSRADLVGRYVGHTAPLVNQVIQSAIGGVLFIDEAYSLYRGKDDQFGLEAIDTLVKGIEDNRDNLIVILAGYSIEMEAFLEANSGLKSRFPNDIDFPDYTGKELLAITEITVRKKGYTLDEGVSDVLLAYYNAVQMVRPDTAGNGRLVRNKVEEAILNQSRRLAAEPDADLSLLTTRDFDLTDVGGEA